MLPVLPMLPALPLLLAALPAAAAREAPARPPNVLLVLCDDLGWSDVGAYSGEVETPGIDRLAREGTRCTQGYTSASTCSPSRAGLLTGRYQQRFGFYGNYDAKAGLPAEETTLAEALKAGGYRTGIVGKWHLGKRPADAPRNHGFDSFYGFTGKGHSYLDLSIAGSPTNPLWRDAEPVDDEGYLTDRLTDEAVAFLERADPDGRPFFLYLSYSAPHLPLEPPPGWPVLESEDPAELERHAFLGLLAGLDRGVARVLDALAAAGLDERTLVFFISDNGGSTEKNRSRNGPFKGRKHELWEGGIRVPFLVRWSGTIPAGRVVDEPVSTLDVFATCLAAAGLEPGGLELDGVDLLPLLTGASEAPPHELLHWIDDEENWALRRGPWKLVEMDLDYELFHLTDDPYEEHDRYPTERDLVMDLVHEHGRFAADLPPRLWKGRAKAGDDEDD